MFLTSASAARCTCSAGWAWRPGARAGDPRLPVRGLGHGARLRVRPLLLLRRWPGDLLGIQFISMGLLAEMIADGPRETRTTRAPADPGAGGRRTLRILITGGAGFIGSHLCDHLLERGHEVICMDNLLTGDVRNIAHIRDPRFAFIQYDVTNYIYVDGPLDAVLHFASPASPIDYLKLPDRDAQGGRARHAQGARALARARARFLLASTSEVYGDPLVHPQQEAYWGNVNPVGVRGVYDEAKRFAEALTMAYHRYHGVDTKIVRIFNTFGPRMRRDDGRAVPNFINQALRGEDLTVYGDGSQTRSFGYISDLIEGLYRLLNSSVNEPVNIGNPQEMTVLEIAEADLEAHRIEEPDRLPAAAGGRSEGAAAGHHPRARPARLGAAGRRCARRCRARSVGSRKGWMGGRPVEDVGHHPDVQ